MRRSPHAVLCVALLLAGCGGKAAPPAPTPVTTETNSTARGDADRAAEPAGGAQGLSDEDRERFYHLAMGSEIFPLAWLQALVSQQTGKPFLDDVDRFGLLSNPRNPDGLPIGFTAAESRDLRFAGKMVGLNCAVCHVGELTYQGKRLRIDGGPSLFQVTAFATDLAESAKATATSASKLFEFLGRVSRQEDQQRRLEAARPGARDVLHAFRDFDALEKAGDLERSFAKHLKSLLDDERDRPAADLNADLVAPTESASAAERFKTLIGEVKSSDLREVLSRKSGALFDRIQDREQALHQTIEESIEIARLLKARAAFALKMASLKDVESLEGGPGRVDDFGSARNVLFAIEFARPTTAPCSIPPLWGTGQLEWSDWDNNTTAAIGRSMATALAGGAAFDPKSFVSTVPYRALVDLESLSHKIEPPAWPDKIFGAIDIERRDRGATLFEQHCAICHVTAPGESPDIRVDLDKIGTDPARLRNFGEKLGDREFADSLATALEQYLNRAIASADARPVDAAKPADDSQRKWRTTGQYAARPLVAVWATAPYLHNGSVPTLHDLLLPADQRPKSFPLGQREFDPVKVGFVGTVDGTPRFTFDTSLPGNSNRGHEFGTELPGEDRRDLIEFMKSR